VTEIVWSPRSVSDLEEIRAYIENDSPAWADLTVRRLVSAVDRLRDFPESGRVVPERRTSDLREVLSGPFRLVYRRTAGRVEVVTVFRGTRQSPSLTA